MGYSCKIKYNKTNKLEVIINIFYCWVKSIGNSCLFMPIFGWCIAVELECSTPSIGVMSSNPGACT